jgi:hypothetical protein
VHDFRHGFGDIGLDLALRLKHGLRALLVELLDRREICIVHGVAQATLQLLVLLVRGVARKMQRNDRVCGCHDPALRVNLQRCRDFLE